MAVDAALEQARVLVVDDHTTFAELLTYALGSEPDLVSAGHARSVKEGVRLCLALKPEVVVMDYHLEDGTGLAAAEQILARAPETRIIMLTGHPTAEALEQAAGLGICAFLPKDGSLSTVLDTLRHARQGNMVVHPSLLSLLSAKKQHDDGTLVPTLTQREHEVLQLMATGHDVRTNARILGISPHTCRGYVKSILAKLNAHSQLEAVVTARRLKLLSGDQG